MTLGIVIVSYRSDELTVRFVREELSRIRTEHTIVIVDNGASEEEAAALNGRLPEAVVLPFENKGYAAGNNYGAAYLREHYHPDYILFTNNDIRLLSDDVPERLAEALEAHPESAVAGPELIGLDGLRQGPWPYQGMWDRYVLMYLSTPFMSREAKAERFALSYPARAEEGMQYSLSGAFLLADAEVFYKIGGFDEATFLYAEENILSDRLGSVGKGMYFLPSVRVLHEHGKTTEKSFREKKRARMQFDSMAYYYRKYRGYSSLSCFLAGLIYRLILLVK